MLRSRWSMRGGFGVSFLFLPNSSKMNAARAYNVCSSHDVHADMRKVEVMRKEKSKNNKISILLRVLMELWCFTQIAIQSVYFRAHCTWILCQSNFKHNFLDFSSLKWFQFKLNEYIYTCLSNLQNSFSFTMPWKFRHTIFQFNL